MAVSNGDILRATATLDLGRGSEMQAVFHYEYTGAGDTDDEVGDEIKDDLNDAWANIVGVLDQLVISSQVDVWLWDTVNKEFNGIYSEPWVTVAGTLVGEMLPNGVAALIKQVTATPRRQGRKYIGGLSELDYTEAGWNAATLAALALMIAEFASSHATANGSLAQGVFNIALESFLAFKAEGLINTFANYQRRRRPGVGI